jgi:hypothetical protein
MGFDGINDGQSKEKKGMERYGDFMIGFIGFNESKEIERIKEQRKKRPKKNVFVDKKRGINRF